ncbi:MAG TPA: hypothetical protein PLL30_06465 [Candidatus Krumholzibacteria bacterium]|nr:hypothetical protein [Candidatus Krumholzibacteria bacterium]HPD71404.1 hypothetical protein [Candidatus Krumholzibacteria bacterium]HRY41663.1 hypothetical protein [Candidatus Krumholzibacteria bacterium]
MDPFLEEESHPQSSFDPLAVLRRFWRRKWLFLVPFGLCLAMAGVAIKTMTPIYQSASQIRVVYEVTNSRLIADESRRFRRPADMDRETLSTIWTIVTGPKFVESVVRETQLYTGLAKLPQAEGGAPPETLTPEQLQAVRQYAGILRQKIRVNQAGEHIFEIGVRDVSARQAFVLARVVLDRFLEEERASRVTPRTNTRDFLTSQRATYVESLQVAENALASYQRGVLSESLVGNPVNAANVVAAEVNLQRLQDQYYNSDVNEMARLEQQAGAIVSAPPAVSTILGDPGIAQVVQDLRSLEFARLLGQEEATVSTELGQARLRLNGLVENRVGRDYPQLGVMDRNRLTQYVYFMVYREAKGHALEALARNIRNFKDFQTRQPVQSARLQELQDEVTARRELLESIDREIAQQTMNLEASMSEVGYRIEVRKDPEVSRQPVEPDKVRLSFMAFALSLAIGCGLVVLSILLDRTFTSVIEIERSLRLPVIGTLPVIQDEHFKQKRRLRVLRWIVLVVAILSVAAVFLLYIYPRLS